MVLKSAESFSLVVTSSAELRWQTTVRTSLLLWELGSWPLLCPRSGRRRFGLEMNEDWSDARRAASWARCRSGYTSTPFRCWVDEMLIEKILTFFLLWLQHASSMVLMRPFVCFKETLKVESWPCGVRPPQSVRTSSLYDSGKSRRADGQKSSIFPYSFFILKQTIDLKLCLHEMFLRFGVR